MTIVNFVLDSWTTLTRRTGGHRTVVNRVLADLDEEDGGYRTVVHRVLADLDEKDGGYRTVVNRVLADLDEKDGWAGRCRPHSCRSTCPASLHPHKASRYSRQTQGRFRQSTPLDKWGRHHHCKEIWGWGWNHRHTGMLEDYLYRCVDSRRWCRRRRQSRAGPADPRRGDPLDADRAGPR